MKKYFTCFLLIAVSLMPVALLSQQSGNRSAASLENGRTQSSPGRVNIGEQPTLHVVPSSTPSAIKIYSPIRNAGIFNYLTPGNEEVLGNDFGNQTLGTGESMMFEVNTAEKSVKFLSPDYKLPAECTEALNISPKWLRTDLLLQFRKLASQNKAVLFANLIKRASDTSAKIVDEVAFCVAHMSIQSLLDPRFLKDPDMLIRNAQWIYRVADSLKYVKLVEYGDYSSGDWHTTTKYHVRDGENGQDKWVEAPRDIYYWYVVHPKLHQEGVWAADDPTDKQQRTYGHFWRDYIWNNDPAHDYTKINIKNSLGRVDTIPRLGNMMQMPEYLWDRTENHWFFGRAFSKDDHALNLLGNWGSQAIPIDPLATDSRPINPIQILNWHKGRCGEDAYLMAAATRTALIPMIFRGTYREDHVFGAFWDEGWHHFEFFRCGLANNGWGWTNLHSGKYYEQIAADYWVLSFVEGTRPDGYMFNHTEDYTSTCKINLSVTDKNGAPIDGARVIFYATPGHPNSGDDGISYSGEAFTDYTGKVSYTAGDNKYYLFQVYHPSFGTIPSETEATFIVGYVQNGALAGAKSKAGSTYADTAQFTKASMPTFTGTDLGLVKNADYFVNLNLKATDITTGVYFNDSQRSRFNYWNPDSIGSYSALVMDQENAANFLSGKSYSAYNIVANVVGEKLSLGLPSEGKWYVALSNGASSNNFRHISANCSLCKGSFTGLESKPDLLSSIKAWPNPFTTSINIECPENTSKVIICDMLGNTVAAAMGTNMCWNACDKVAPGVYFIKAYSPDGILTQKVVLGK